MPLLSRTLSVRNHRYPNLPSSLQDLAWSSVTTALTHLLWAVPVEPDVAKVL